MPPARGGGQHTRPAILGYSHPYNAHHHNAHPHSPLSPLLPSPDYSHLAPAGPYGSSSLPSEHSSGSASSITFAFPPSDEETKPILHHLTPPHAHSHSHSHSASYHPRSHAHHQQQQPPISLPMSSAAHPQQHMQHLQSEYAESSMAGDGDMQDQQEQDDELSGPGGEGGSGGGGSGNGRARGSAGGSKKSPSQRQQFTACGACRLRRVKCDLKDVAAARADPREPLQCSNCRQRQLNCVDEYAKKPAKMQRRGRRLQQAQAIYGYGTQSSPSPTTPFSQQQRQSVIPLLQPTFFESEFFRHFYFQRPIVDSSEFASFREPGGMGLLGEAGDLVAKCLVIWAASYGVDAAGVVVSPTRHDLKERMQTCKPMVLEVLDEVDRRGILRNLSWDNVRLVCLLLPLTLETLTTHARNAMYRAALSQAYELSRPGVDPVRVSGAMELVTFLKLRILWYVLVFEGVKTALYGNPLLLDEEVWKGCLPQPRPTPFENGPPPPAAASIPKPSRPSRSQAASAANNAVIHKSYVPADDLSALWGYALPPVDASFACRRIHAELTCDRAVSRPTVDPKAVQKIWELLERCWQEFEDLKSFGPVNVPAGTSMSPGGSMNILPVEERAMLASRWQIFLVECHVVILDALKTRLMRLSQAKPNAVISSDSPISSPVEPPSSEFANVQELIASAKGYCARAVERGIAMLPWLLSTNLFQHDSTLVCRGVFLSGRFILEENRATEEDISLCIQALERMHWAFGDSWELDSKLRQLVDEENLKRQRSQQAHHQMAPSMQPSGPAQVPWDYSPALSQQPFATGFTVPPNEDYHFPSNVPGNLPGHYASFNHLSGLVDPAAHVHMYGAAQQHDPHAGTGGAAYAQDQMSGSDLSYGDQVNGSGQPTPDSGVDPQPFAYSVNVGPGGSSTSPSTVHNSRPPSSHTAFHHPYSAQMDSFALHTPTGTAFPPYASPNNIGHGSAMHFVAQEFASANAFEHPLNLEHPSPSKPVLLQDQTYPQYPFDQAPYNTSPYLHF